MEVLREALKQACGDFDRSIELFGRTLTLVHGHGRFVGRLEAIEALAKALAAFGRLDLFEEAGHDNGKDTDSPNSLQPASSSAKRTKLDAMKNRQWAKIEAQRLR